MDDLVSRSAVIALYKKWLPQLESPEDAGDKRGVETCIMVLEDFPAVDAVEVVRGKWKYYHKQGIAVCTNCSFERNVDDNFGRAIACPNCGADMRERREDG